MGHDTANTMPPQFVSRGGCSLVLVYRKSAVFTIREFVLSQSNTFTSPVGIKRIWWVGGLASKVAKVEVKFVAGNTVVSLHI
jgi:hypothetical protein